jgi:glyoxylase-like metal-dependent hydrolase (beta-lactamase superfamily II)
MSRMNRPGTWFFAWAVALGLASACASDSHPPLAPTPDLPPPPPPAETAPPVPVAVAPEVTPVPKLALSVYTSSPEGLLTTSTLVAGAKDAILIDAQFTLPDAKKLVEMLKASGKNLTLVYVTHQHPDHYFGFEVIKEAFPKVKLVALPATVAGIQKTAAEKLKQWKPLYKDAITKKPIVPEPLDGNSLELEGEAIEVVGGVQGDEAGNSYVYIPSLHTAIVGDIAYDGVFPWTAETTPAERSAWIAALDAIAARNPTAVIAGHQKPDDKLDTSAIQFTKDYLRAYDEAISATKSAAELQAKMKAKYPDAALDVILKLGAEAAFQPPAKPDTKTKPAAKQP